MPIAGPGDRDMYGNVIPEPKPKPTGPTPEARLKQLYIDREADKARHEAQAAAVEASPGAGLIRAEVMGEGVRFVNPDTVQSVENLGGSTCKVILTTGEELPVDASVQDFTRKMEAPEKPPEDAIERLAWAHRPRASGK